MSPCLNHANPLAFSHHLSLPLTSHSSSFAWAGWLSIAIPVTALILWVLWQLLNKAQTTNPDSQHRARGLHSQFTYYYLLHLVFLSGVGGYAFQIGTITGVTQFAILLILIGCFYSTPKQYRSKAGLLCGLLASGAFA